MEESMAYPLQDGVAPGPTTSRMMWPLAPYCQQEWEGITETTPIISGGMNALLGDHGRIHGLPTAG